MKHLPTLRVIRILDQISFYSEHGVTLTEIMKTNGMPKSTVYNIVSTLVAEGVVEETKDTPKRYKLGFMAYIVASRYVEKLDIINIARPILTELSNLTNMTSYISKIDVQNIYYVFKYKPKEGKQFNVGVNSTEFIHCTSSGKAYLMTLSLTEYKKKTQELDFEEITEKTVLTKEDLLTEVQSFKKIGYSKDVEESERGKVCFGAPVFNDEGEYVCSVNICGGVEEVQQEELYGKLIKQAALKISTQLGYDK